MYKFLLAFVLSGASLAHAGPDCSILAKKWAEESFDKSPHFKGVSEVRLITEDGEESEKATGYYGVVGTFKTSEGRECKEGLTVYLEYQTREVTLNDKTSTKEFCVEVSQRPWFDRFCSGSDGPNVSKK